MVTVGHKRRCKGSKTCLTLNKKSKRYHSRMSIQSTYEINESDVNSIQQSEIDSCELHFVEKETQMFQHTYHDVGIQISPPSNQSNST